jgi:hypothetical protein
VTHPLAWLPGGSSITRLPQLLKHRLASPLLLLELDQQLLEECAVIPKVQPADGCGAILLRGLEDSPWSEGWHTRPEPTTD